MIILVSIILLLVFTFLGVDFYLNINEWQSRIHIGRWSDRKEWLQALEKKAWHWLQTTPAVRTTDNTRLLLWDILKGKYRNNTVQSWQDAGLLLGLGADACQKYTKSHPDLFKKGFETDQALLAFALARHNSLTEIQKQVVIDFFKPYTSHRESIPYRSYVKNIRFVDTIGMTVPFLHLTGMDEAASLQVKDYDKAMLRGVFPAHAYNLETDLPLGVHDWARGIGWYILGLIFSETVADHQIRIVKLADALLPLQQPEGGYSCFVFNKKNRMESSGTVLIGLLMVKAFSLSHDLKYLKCALQVEKALMSATRRDGSLDYCQADTQGTGFYSHIFSTMPFAQGLTILFIKELIKYET